MFCVSCLPGMAGPHPIYGLAGSVANAEVIVGGTYLGVAGASMPAKNGPRLAQLQVQRVIKGDVPLGRLDVYLGGSVAGPVEGQIIAFLDRDGDGFQLAKDGRLGGDYGFLGADGTGYEPGRNTLDEVVRELGQLVVDPAAPTLRRTADVRAICGEPSARHFLQVASGDSLPEIRYLALACRISAGELDLLGPLLPDLAVTAPPAPAGALVIAGTIRSIRSPAAVPILSRYASQTQLPFRLAALAALGYTHSPTALPALREALLRGGFEVRYAAVLALPYVLSTDAKAPLSQSDFRAHEDKIVARWLERIQSVH